MAQESAWDREYRDSKLLTKENKPQGDVVRFAHFLKKEERLLLEGLNILDLGCGTGRNSYYFAELGNNVTGVEISQTAIDFAKRNAQEKGLDINYIKQSIGDEYPFDENQFDIALDVTSSNSLTEKEREVYLKETQRTLKSGGYFFVKGLCKDGDQNAKSLLSQFPGSEKDTYTMPGLKITERVWSKEDFVATYEPYFKILKMGKKTSYSRMNNRSYKRNFWIVYMRKA